MKAFRIINIWLHGKLALAKNMRQIYYIKYSFKLLSDSDLPIPTYEDLNYTLTPVRINSWLINFCIKKFTIKQ